MSDNPRERFIRVIPGRIRIEVIGLKRNPIVASALLSRFQSLPGIRSVNPSLETGRVLIYYDMTQIGLGQMAQEIIHIEKMYSLSKYNVEQISHEHQVAATLDNTQNASPRSVESIAQKEPALTPYPTPKMMIPASNRHSTIPAGLAISVTGAALLGIRQLVLGKSAFAGSPLLFTASALISIISGYPFIRRQFHHAANTARANPNFILGASALALALLRENVIVLASISLIELLKWKRSKNPNLVNEPIRIPQEIKEYSEKTSRQSMITAGAAWALTKNPYVGLAVLLAGNPRVASVPAEYTWSQASLTARQQGLLIPHHTSLPELSRINTVVLEDTTLITNKQESEILCAANKHHEAKVWHFAASIMKKINHPWKDGVVTKAKTYPGTIRAAFKVQTTAEGYHAIIHGDEVILGNLQYLRKNHVDCDHYVIEIKRWERQGYEVICLAKNNQYAGCLRKQTGELEQRTVTALQKLQHHNIKVKALNNSLNMHESYLSNYGISLLEPSDKFKLITKEKSSENLLLITNQNLSSSSELGNPRILSLNEVSELQKTIQYARRVDQLANQNFWVAKIWNRVGTMLSVINFLAAPIVNLVGDYFTLLLLARSKRTIEKTLSAKSLSEEINCLETQKQSLLPRGTQPWHTFSTEELLRQFSVHEQYGLPQEKVALLKSQYGPNQLEQKQSPPWLFSYLSQFKEFTTLVVMGTSLLALLTGEIFDGLAMGSILLINAGIGTFQERKADKVIDALNEFQPPKCKVIRDGIQTEIAGNELVPGDIISLGAGDRVPADLRLLRAWNLEANEAALTGESLPVEKSPDVLAEPCSLADCKNMLFLGTDITRGKGLGLVVGTGMNTEIGYLMSLMKTQEKTVTPLHEKVTGISKTFVKLAAIAGGLVFLSGILRGWPLTQMISTSITLAASAIPEGLPVTITIALSAGIFYMSKKNALIRKLSVLETLGRTTVICTDKTGTLTKNEMMVKKIASIGGSWEVTGSGYEPVGEVKPLHNTELSDEPIDQELKYLARISLLCNNSILEQDQETWRIKGDPTEGALLTLAAKLGLHQDQNSQWQRVHEVPFDSNSGSMTVVCRDVNQDQDCFVFCKGSVESILNHCKYYQYRGEIIPLTSEMKKKILQQNIEYASEALRVLGFAYSPIVWADDSPADIPEELIYVGIAGMMDPPKPDIIKSTREAYALGVRPVMITGDHPITAIAIAKELGIGNGNTKVLNGQEIDRLTDSELVRIVEDIHIFARVTPEHKLRIVKAFQSLGHVVAMTGDGVNDTPAIKQANIGISMGTGTEVTKAAADMVLKKDHFGSILEGIKQGRTIIGNIRKAIGCLLTGNLAEILVTATAVVAGLPIPLVPIQILLMNLLTDAIPAMILAVNPGNNNTQLQTRIGKDVVDRELYVKVITRGVILATASLGMFYVTLASGVPIAVAQTAAFVSLVVGQFVQTLSWRMEGNQEGIKHAIQDRYLLGGLALSFSILLAAIYFPPFARFFYTTPLSIKHWLGVFITTGLVSKLSKLFVPIFIKQTAKQINQDVHYLAGNALSY